jgi:hypothetical protein
MRAAGRRAGADLQDARLGREGLLGEELLADGGLCAEAQAMAQGNYAIVGERSPVVEAAPNVVAQRERLGAKQAGDAVNDGKAPAGARIVQSLLTQFEWIAIAGIA